MAARLALSVEHRARELLHGIMLATRCTEISSTTSNPAAEVAAAGGGVTAWAGGACAAGLDRDFRRPQS